MEEIRYTWSMKIRFSGALIALFLGLFLSGCDSHLGYSVVLWNDAKHNITDGTIVKVYIRSNISHVYVIGLPDSKEKVEVPLWTLTEPESKKRALKQQKRFSDFEHTYASVKLDGLPIRAEAVNTAKQVYRLREKEIIRVLYRTKGQAVTNGHGNMSGEWLRVLTDGGTVGWCFSHNLELFQNEGAQVAHKEESVQEETHDALLEGVLAKKWYPEEFKSMIESGRIDPVRMNPSYGFDTGAASGTVSVNLSQTSLSWKFEAVTKIKGREYQFANIPVKMTVKTDSYIIVEYTDQNARLHAENFISLDADVEELVASEIARREKELEQIRLYGPKFESSNYGKLTFRDGGAFEWSGYNLLVPSIVARSAKGNGTVSVNYFISESLKLNYDGVLTFSFSGMQNKVNFLYKMTDGGLRLEDASHAQISNGMITSRSTSPLVIFFSRK